MSILSRFPQEKTNELRGKKSYLLCLWFLRSLIPEAFDRVGDGGFYGLIAYCKQSD